MRMLWFLVAFLVAMVAAESSTIFGNATEKVRYDDCVVYKLKIKNKMQLEALKFMETQADKFIIWKEYDKQTQEVHIMVSPQVLNYFKQLLNTFGIKREIMIENVQSLIDMEQVPVPDTQDDDYTWTRYHSFDEINQWLDNVLHEHADVAEEIIIGKSYDGRTIRGIKISYKPNNPGLFIESNIHAREWITVETTTWLINQLLTSTDVEVRELAESVDWYIVPLLNVDGYVYSYEKDRLWRKTRQPNAGSQCIGADPNRNFDIYWLENGGGSSDPCSFNFAGTAPFSEPEIRAIADYIESIKDRLNILLAFHSYGQLVLSPYGHTSTERPPNHNDLIAVGQAYAAAVENLPYKTNYVVGPTAETLYVATGSTDDWAYTKMDIKLSYTMEFRDNGRYGFVLPPIYILPNCEETLAGLIALVKKAKELDYLTIKY